jgi:hypothetical protein
MAAPLNQLDIPATLERARRVIFSLPLSAALQPERRELVVVYETQSISDALLTLAAWRLLSAPVLAGPPPWLAAKQEKSGDDDALLFAGSGQEDSASLPRLSSVVGWCE